MSRQDITNHTCRGCACVRYAMPYGTSCMGLMDKRLLQSLFSRKHVYPFDQVLLYCTAIRLFSFIATRPIAPYRNFLPHTSSKRAILPIHPLRPYTNKDSTHSPATRKQIRGPLTLVAIVAAVDLSQLPICHQLQANPSDRSGTPTYPFSCVHRPGPNWRLDNESVSFCVIGSRGPIPNSLRAMWLSGVSGLGNCGMYRRVLVSSRKCEPRFRRRVVSRSGLGGSLRL